jgi:hypothetical protein
VLSGPGQGLEDGGSDREAIGRVMPELNQRGDPHRIGFAIPIGIDLLMGERDKGMLRGVFVGMMTHDKALTAGTMFFLEAIFVGRALGGLLS